VSTETQYKPHPAANLFPMMPADQFAAFKEDIRKNGFQQDIVLYKGQILDGRNRYKAAVELDMLDDLPIAEMDDDTDIDPYQWVISRNLHRRHLNESQRAKIAAKLAKLKHGDVASQKHDMQICTSTKQAAEMLQVSPRSVAHAKVVEEHGSPELNEAVERGEVAVSKAAKIARETPKEQQAKKAKEKSLKEKATNGVRIDSGPLEATDKFEQVPKDKWRTLMRVKRDFLSANLAYDCRCLVEFCQEAELVYNDCGFTSAAEMIQHGYELDPVEIELAVAWLKHNQPKDNQS
jgi:ParB-like chromosome segregation protein Spo0J